MPDEPEEEGFTFRDRRRFVNETPAPEASKSGPLSVTPEDPVTEEEDFEASSYAETSPWAEAEGAEDSSLPDVYSVLALFLGELRNLAWLRMGLVANPATGQIERDMPQARIAIDTVTFLAGQLEPAVAPEERLPLKALVSDLQLNFVEQSKRGA